MENKINNNRQIRSSLIFVIGTLLAGMISFLNAPVLTRCLSTELYVEYSMFMSLSAVITAVSYIGYDSAYMRFYHNNTGFGFLIKCLKYPLGLWALITLLLFLLRDSFLSYILGAKISIAECVFLCIYLLVKLIARFTLLTMRMESRAWNYAVSDCLEKLFFIIAVFILKCLFGTVLFSSILICIILGYVIEIFINCVGFSKSLRAFSVQNSTSATDFELFRFGVFLGITNGGMFCIPLIQKTVVRSLLDTSGAAIYFAASIFQTAISLISISINNIWEPKLYKAVNEGENLKPIFHKYGIFVSWFLLTILGFVIMLRRLFVLILEEQYYDVFIIAPCITFSACMTIIYNFYSVGIEIKKKTWIRSLIPFIELLISIIFLYAITEQLGIRGAAIAMLIGSISSKAVGIFIGLKLYDTGQKMIIPVLCWCISLVVSVISLWLSNWTLDFVVGICAVIIGFILSKREIGCMIKELVSSLSK